MKEKKSISGLILQARQYVLERGYTAPYRYNCHWIWKKFGIYAEENQHLEYSTELGMEFFYKWTGYSPEDKIKKNNDCKLRAMKVIDDLFHGRSVKRRYTKSVYVPEVFSDELERYKAYLVKKGQRPRTIETKTSRILVFLRFLEDNSIELSRIDFQTIEKFHQYITGIYNQNAQANIKFTLRNFFEFGEQIGIVHNGTAELIGIIYSNKHERLPSTYTIDELNKILSVVDRKTSNGIRDYAFLMILIYLGMRSSDVINLKLNCIHPEDHSIVFKQQKTGTTERLPLTEDIELALADYIKNVRPAASSELLFIFHDGVKKGNCYSDGILYGMLNKYMKKADINTEGKRYGPHSLRHSLSSNLFRSGTSLQVISGVLCHSSSEITTRYVWMDIEQLRKLTLEVPYED